MSIAVCMTPKTESADWVVGVTLLEAMWRRWLLRVSLECSERPISTGTGRSKRSEWSHLRQVRRQLHLLSHCWGVVMVHTRNSGVLLYRHMRFLLLLPLPLPLPFFSFPFFFFCHFPTLWHTVPYTELCIIFDLLKQVFSLLSKFCSQYMPTTLVGMARKLGVCSWRLCLEMHCLFSHMFHKKMLQKRLA